MGHTEGGLDCLFEGKTLPHVFVSVFHPYVLTSYLVGGSFNISLRPSNRPPKIRHPSILPADTPQQKHPYQCLRCLFHHHWLHGCLLLGFPAPVSSSCADMGYGYTG